MVARSRPDRESVTKAEQVASAQVSEEERRKASESQKRMDDALAKGEAILAELFNGGRSSSVESHVGVSNDSGAPKENDATVICPKCKARNAYHASEKGFGFGKAAVWGTIVAWPVGFAAGLFGRKDVVLTCLKCRHKWTPG